MNTVFPSADRSSPMSIGSAAPEQIVCSEHPFDEEFLIRVFVRIKRGETRREDLEESIYSRILQRTNYRLPHVNVARDKNEMSKRISADIAQLAVVMKEQLDEQENEMQVRKHTFTMSEVKHQYFDAVSGYAITYADYEERYYSFLKRSGLSMKSKVLCGEKLAAMSTPSRRLSRDFESKRLRTT